MTKDELLNKICDLITDATVDPSGESIMTTTKEIMNLIDEYEKEHVNEAQISHFREAL